MARMKSEGEVRGHETALVAPDGRRVPVTIAVLPLRDPGGALAGTLGIVAARSAPQG
jgi:hypothetical protein